MGSEFERIKDRSVYFDWNIISYFCFPKHNPEGIFRDAYCLKQLLDECISRDDYVYPFSEAHLHDIHQGDQLSLETKLKFLQGFSRGWLIHRDPVLKQNLRLDKLQNLTDFYDQIFKDSDRFQGISDTEEIKSIKANFAAQIDQSIEAATDINQKNMLQEFARIVRAPDNGLDVLRFNKKYRNLGPKHTAVKYAHLSPNALNLDPEDFKAAVKKALAASNLPIRSYEDFVALCYPVRNEYFSDFMNDVMQSAGFADYLGLAQEKLDKDSAFTAITTDQRHLKYGLSCNYFISADERLILKAKFVKKWLGLNVKIFNIEDFTRYILKDIESFLRSKRDIQFRQFSFEFRDEDKNVLKKYSLPLD